MNGEQPGAAGEGAVAPHDVLPRERPSASFDPDDELPLVHADEVGDPVRDASVAGVLLAAGTSSRFAGDNKLLVEVDGEPLVGHAARTLLEAAIDLEPIVAVVGHESGRIRESLSGLEIDVVDNPDYREGQATSVRVGLDAVGDVDAALFALGDMPFVLPRTIVGLVTAYHAGVGEALAAAYRGDRGNPVLFGEPHFGALADVEGDTGGRDVLLNSDDAALVETGDPGVLADVDTHGDIEAFG